MSIAEVFLMLWAVLATVLAVVLQGLLKRAVAHHKAVSFLLAEVATGEVKAKDAGNGFISVENDDLRMTFKKVGD
jgi:hypothetical protein